MPPSVEQPRAHAPTEEPNARKRLREDEAEQVLSSDTAGSTTFDDSEEGVASVEILGDPPSAGFPAGSLRLRRAQLNKETRNLKDKVKDCRLKELISVQQFYLPLSAAVREGVSLAQRKVHLYTLMDLLDLLNDPSMRQHYSKTFPVIMIEALVLMQRKRKWGAPTTMLTKASSLMGCLKRLQQYANLPSIDLLQSSEWMDAMKGWTKKATAHLPSLRELSLAQVKRILPRLSPECQVVLLIAWLHAGRVSNIFTLQAGDLHFSKDPKDPQGYRFSITWFRAKTSATIGAYTTHSWISEEGFKTLQAWTKNLRSQDWLLPQKLEHKLTKELRQAIRCEDPKADLRALRRGALQALAKANIDLEIVRVFSGHTTVQMLLRYLGRGLAAGKRSQEGAAAAKKALAL